MVEESALEKMHYSSKDLGKEVSEVKLFSIETERLARIGKSYAFLGDEIAAPKII